MGVGFLLLRPITFHHGLVDAGEWQLRIASVYEFVHAPFSAEALYRRILRQRPADLRALSRLGRLLLRSRRYDEAIHVWGRTVELHPRLTFARFQLARSLHRCGRLEDAIDQYLAVLELDGAHAKAFAAAQELNMRFASKVSTILQSQRAARYAAALTSFAALFEARPGALKVAEALAGVGMKLASSAPDEAV